MSKPIHIFFALFLTLGITHFSFAQNELNSPSNFSWLSAVPRGCFETVPSLVQVPEQQLLVSGIAKQTVSVPDLPFDETVDISVKIWRHGCHESNRSAIMMNLSLPEGFDEELLSTVVMRPVVTFSSSGVEDQLFTSLWQGGYAEVYSPSLGIYGFVEDSFPNGVTYVLDTYSYVVSGDQFDQLIDRYNSGGELRITWGGPVVTATIPAYDPASDLPQKAKPSFTGRMTGQWVADDLPATGLLLQIGEIPKQYRNFIFAIWFTYIDGQPVWMAANKDISVGTNEVTLDMGYFEGGKLFTTAGGFSSDDVSATTLGTMTLRIINCNEIEVSTDFSSSGFGSNTLKLERLIRIAGYDCDGTQAIK